MRRDLDCRVHTRCGGTTDQQRNLAATTPFITLHLAGHMRHFFQRGRDQARQANDVGVVIFGGLQNLLCRHHHAQVDHLKVIALEHDRDNILANVMHIAFDGGDDHLAFGLCIA